MHHLSLLVVVVVVACSSPKASPTPTAAAPTSSPPPPPTTPAPGIGETCGPADACAPPATCVSYLGIAGARGPTFKSCEIKCGPDAPCLAGRTCRTIADGPGSVCR